MERFQVLVAEDEESDRMLLQLAVKRSGLPIDLSVVTNGRDAIRYLAGEPPYTDRIAHPVPALILLDLHMPIMSGFDVLEWLRTRSDLQQIPAVVLTSSTHVTDRQLALALGAAAYEIKPSRAHFFDDVIKRLFDRWLQCEPKPGSKLS